MQGDASKRSKGPKTTVKRVLALAQTLALGAALVMPPSATAYFMGKTGTLVGHSLAQAPELVSLALNEVGKVPSKQASSAPLIQAGLLSDLTWTVLDLELTALDQLSKQRATQTETNLAHTPVETMLRAKAPTSQKTPAFKQPTQTDSLLNLDPSLSFLAQGDAFSEADLNFEVPEGDTFDPSFFQASEEFELAQTHASPSAAASSLSAGIDRVDSSQIELRLGKAQVLNLMAPAKRVSLSNPAVASVVMISPYSASNYWKR